MQKALLGLAIAIILVLLTALVGPYFIDWGDYRAQFEAVAARLVGMQVKVVGPIELRILPTPVVTLQEITVGRPGEINPTHARALRIEFALPALIGGDLRAAEVTLAGPSLALNMDAAGQLDWAAPSISFNPDAVSIDHLVIEDGRAILTNAATRTRLVVDKLDFTGQVGSLRGPVKGDGSFTLDGRTYPYALTTSRSGDDGTIKLRLNFDPATKSRTAQLDASLMLDNGIPRFDGNFQWAHVAANVANAAGRGSDGDEPGRKDAAAADRPWRLSAHIRGDSASAQLDQVELQYGPDDQSVRLRGTGKLDLGAKPELSADLSASEIDLDRALAAAAGAQGPLAAGRNVIAALAGAPPPPLAVNVGIGVDMVTLAGAPLQNVHMDLRADGAGWSVASLALRAPGFTQLSLKGRLRSASGSIEFAGASRVTSADPAVLIGWLAGRGGVQLSTPGSLRLSVGDAKIDGNRIALGRLEIEHDRSLLDGHVDYAWPTAGGPASLDVNLQGPRLDIDGMVGLLKSGWAAGVGGLPFTRPGRVGLTLDLQRALIAGVEAKNVAVKVMGDAGALTVERLAVGDIGGAKLAFDGHIDHLVDADGATPRGRLRLDLDARSLDGIAALIEKVSVPDAERLRRVAARMVPAKLMSSLELGPASADATAPSVTTLALNGSAGQFHIDMHANVKAEGGGALGGLVAGYAADSPAARPARLGDLDLTARLDAFDGSRLAELMGLDRIVAMDKRTGFVTLEARGPLDRDIAVKGKVAAGGFDFDGSGMLRLSDAIDLPQGRIGLTIKAEDVKALRPVLDQRAVPPKADLHADLVLARDEVALDRIEGKVADTGIKGRLAVALAQSPRLDGDLTIDSVDVPRAIAAAIGVPHKADGDGAAWPAEPFEEGLIGEGWAGSLGGGAIKIRAARATLTPKLSVADLSVLLGVTSSGIEATDVDGKIAGGRVTGNLALRRGNDGVTAQAHLAVVSADAAALLPADGAAVTGRLAADLDLTGGGRSPVALIGSLAGSGTLTLQNGTFARLDPAAFETVLRAVDRGLATDATRVGERMEAALSGRALPIAQARASIAVSSGQLALTDLSVEANGADLAVKGGVDLTERSLSASLTLTEPVAADAEAGQAPPIFVTLAGPIVAPRRALNVDKLSGWLTLRAAEQNRKRLDALQAARETSSDPADSTGAANEPAAPPRPVQTSPVLPASPSRQRPQSAQPSASIGAPIGTSTNRSSDAPRPPRALPPAPLDIRPGTAR